MRLFQRAADRTRELQKEADSLAAQQGTLLEEIKALERDRQLKTAELTAVNNNLETVRAELEETQAYLATVEQNLEEQQPLIEARLVALYKMGTPRYAKLLLGADNLASLGRAYRLLGSLVRSDRERFEEHQRRITQLRTSRAALEQRQAESVELQQTARDARRALIVAIEAQTALVEAIDARRDLAAQLTSELAAAGLDFEGSLTALTANSSLPATRITLPLRPFKGEIEAPVPGNVTASFCGERPSAFRTTVARGGIEFAVVVGEPIRAVHEGQVAFAGPFEELGTLVIVDHGDQSFSLYGYLQSLQTSAGAWVDAGAELGTAGSSPTGAPALYFELRVDGRPVDPLEWLKLLS